MGSAAEAKRIQVVWAPQPGPQAALVSCPAQEIFFGGARGGGKTDGVIGKWGIKAMQYGSDFNAIMFRKTLVSADDAIERSRQIYEPLGARLKDNPPRWRFPNNARIGFRYLDSVADADHYQGKNITDAWIEEAGQYPSPDPIDRLFGALRSPAGIPTQMILTANPGGAGQSWLRDRYCLHPLPHRPIVVDRKRADGETVKAAVIPSKIADNRILLSNDPGYVERLKLVGNAELVRAWLDGDWSAIEGAFFSDWSQDLILDPFEVPTDWIRFRAFDWGSAKPFSVGWWAYATHDAMGVEKGAMVRYREWYGASKPNVGLKLPAEEVRDGILDREAPGERIDYSMADPAIFAEDGGPSLAERMLPIAWQPADNRRVGVLGHIGGWDQMRARMRDRMLFVFRTCHDFQRTIPLLQHDPKRPEDLDTTAEDHCFAAGTMVKTLFGDRPIETLRFGFVLTTSGWRWFRGGRMTRTQVQTVELQFDDGSKIRCTGDHLWMNDRGEWIEAKRMRDEKCYNAISNVNRRSAWSPSSAQPFKSSTANVSTSAEAIFSAREEGFTGLSGLQRMVRFRKGRISTTKMATGRITILKTLSFSRKAIMQGFIKRGARKETGNWSMRSALLPLSGTAPPRAPNGIEGNIRKIAKRLYRSLWRSIALTAAKPSIVHAGAEYFARTHAGPAPEDRHARTTRPEFVRSAAKSSRPTNMRRQGAALENAAQSSPVCVDVKPGKLEDVFCITVPSVGSFALKNGAVVSNCADESRYACMSRIYMPRPKKAAVVELPKLQPRAEMLPKRRRQRRKKAS